MNREEKYSKEFQKLNVDFGKAMVIISDLLSLSLGKKEHTSINYTKGFFTHYYCIDAETFNKWIMVFCKDLVPGYKNKRKFNNQEVDYIFENLGYIPSKLEKLVDRKAVLTEIYKNTKWKKSRLYAEFSLELQERFPNLNIKLNKLPPKLMFTILKDELEHFDFIAAENRNLDHEYRLYSIFKFFEKYNSFDEQQWEIRKRSIRRQFNKYSDDESITSSPSNS